MVHLFHNFASFTNEVFGQLLSIYNRYGANLNMKAVSFFYSPSTHCISQNEKEFNNNALALFDLSNQCHFTKFA